MRILFRASRLLYALCAAFSEGIAVVRPGGGLFRPLRGPLKLAVYIVRPPVALERIDYQQAVGVVFRAPRPSAAAHDSIPKEAPRYGALRLDPLESLAALTDHIPDKGQHLVRFYGWYSNKNRGLRKKQPLLQMPYSATTAVGPEIVEPSASVTITSAGRPPNDSPDDDDDFRRDCRRTWARLIKKVYEVDPLICPRCGYRLRWLSFIEDPPVVRRILDHLGLWDAGAAPPTCRTHSRRVYRQDLAAGGRRSVPL